MRDNPSIIFICVQVSSVILDVVLRIRVFRSHTHQDPVHLQIFYKGMLDYLAPETVDQMLPRLNDLLQINGEKTTFFIDLVFFNLRLQFLEVFWLRKKIFLMELKKLCTN